MPIVEISDKDLALLARLHEEREKSEQDIPHAHEVFTEIPSLQELKATLAVSLNGSEFHLSSGLSIPLFPRREKKEKAQGREISRDVSLTPWVTAILIVMILIGIVSYESSTLSETTRSASPHLSVKTPVPMGQANEYSVVSGPTVSAAYIDRVLCGAQSPACHTGQALYDLGVQYNIDPAFALAFFLHESSYGTQGEASMTLSLGNLRCYVGATCVDQDRGGYAAYTSWEAGYQAWYELIRTYYIAQRGLTTVDTIIPVYAPTADHNDEAAYIASVEHSVAIYRAEGGHV